MEGNQVAPQEYVVQLIVYHENREAGTKFRIR